MNLSVVLNGSAEQQTDGTEKAFYIGDRLEAICDVAGSELRKLVWEPACESSDFVSESHTVSCSDTLEKSTFEVVLF